LKFVITGANGMLGSTLCQLYNKKYDVYAFHRDKEFYSECTDEFSFDLLNMDFLQSVIKKIKPDIFIHCASLTDVDQCEKYQDLAYASNVQITENIARVCGNNNIKLIYISSDQIYGGTNDYSEDNNILLPKNNYGKTKLLGEKKVLKYCPEAIIVRTNIFGWNVKPNRISFAEWIYFSLKNRKKIILFTDYIFSPIYTELLGEKILELIKKNFINIINLGSPVPCSKYDFGIMLAHCFGFDKSLINKGVIEDHKFVAKREKNLSLNTKKAYNAKISLECYKDSLIRFKRDQVSL